MVQSWVSDDRNSKVKDFIITPPLFVIKASSDNLLKVVYTGDKDRLPKDRENIFYLNVKVIPSLSENEQKVQNALLISNTTRIKIFTRPDLLKDESIESYKDLTCNYESGKIKMNNGSPFYLNLVSLAINGKEFSEAVTIPPKSSVYLDNSIKGQYLTYNFINDYGVQIKNNKCML